MADTDLLTQGFGGAWLTQGFPSFYEIVVPPPPPVTVQVGDWDDMLVNTVVFKTISPASDTSGDSANGTPSEGTTYKASVQPADPGRTVIHAGVEEMATHALFFNTEPVDSSAGARTDGRCRIMDQFVWLKYPLNPSQFDTLYALGEAVDLVGWDELWKVDAVLRR